jgi:hypothetical protein
VLCNDQRDTEVRNYRTAEKWGISRTFFKKGAGYFLLINPRNHSKILTRPDKPLGSEDGADDLYLKFAQAEQQGVIYNRFLQICKRISWLRKN